MATFRASKRFHFSDDGRSPWALFERVPDSDPAEYEFSTDDPSVAARLDGVSGVVRADGEKVAAVPAGPTEAELKAWFEAEAKFHDDVLAWLAAEEQHKAEAEAPKPARGGSK